MYTKLEIKGTLEVKTGMHIGGSSAFSAIGAVDSPVIRDTLTAAPIIPGSSLKGKIRALLAKELNGKKRVKTYDEDNDKILRLFGSSTKDQNGKLRFSRLIFSDMRMSNIDELKSMGAERPTEIKFENNINRLTAVAMPRQIERVIRGAQFPFSVIYNVEDENEVVEDIEILVLGLKLLSYDYLGGHGSRGYGKVEFEKLTVDVAVGEIDGEVIAKCRDILGEI